MNFDEAALTYDQLFTFSEIGKRQRKVVWDYLEKSLIANIQLNILELNCGTGEDAIYLAKKGHRVVATDASAKMVEIVNCKIKESKLTGMVRAMHLPIQQIPESGLERDFDLVFSNFGGLNCLPIKALRELSANLLKVLKPKGKFIAVVMAKHCLWEHFYFLIKLKSEKAFRRSKENDDSGIWYYSPSEFEGIFSEYFGIVRQKPVGLFIPPSYLEPFFQNKTSLLDLLEKAETTIGQISLFSALADHYIIELERR